MLGVAPVTSTAASAAPAGAVVEVATASGDEIRSPASDGDDLFWTPERMAAATPDDLSAAPARSQRVTDVPLLPAGDVSEYLDDVTPQQPIGVSATASVTPMAVSDGIPSSVGKLYYTRPNGSFGWCTASVIDTKSGWVVLTAAHCIKGVDSGYNKDFGFAPGQISRSLFSGRPYGVFQFATSVAVSTSWANNNNFYADYGVVSFKGRKDIHGNPPSMSLAQGVGANGIRWPGIFDTVFHHKVEVWGYPGAGKWASLAGNTPVGWEGHADSRPGNTFDMVINTDRFTGGASGGPWLENRNGATGSIVAVTSRVDSNANPTQSYAYRVGTWLVNLILAVDDL